VDDSKMPVSALNALPAKAAEYLPDNGMKDLLGAFNTARFATIVFSAFVAWLVFSWTRALYGALPGLVSLLLFVFDPNIIAHSQLVTTDLYLTGAVLFSMWGLWRFARQRTLLNCLLSAFAIGLSQITKVTALALYPLFFASLIISDAPALIDAFKAKDNRKVIKYLSQYLSYAGVIAVVSMLMINWFYGFNRTLTPFGSYSFSSAAFRDIQSRFPVLEDIPAPLPYPYLQGIDLLLQTEGTGMRYGNVYLLGQVHTDGSGFKGYYFVASFFKVPIAIQLILMAALMLYFYDRRRFNRLLQNELFLFTPILLFTVYFNFFFNPQVGFRYYLCVFPLFYVFAGHLFQNWRGFSQARKAAVISLLIYLVVSVLSYYPRYISYFNEFVWDRKTAYQYLGDSNLDWGQDYDYLQEYRAKNHNVFRAPEIPGRINRTRIYFISSNRLVGVTIDPGTYEWLRENFEPTGMITPMYPLFMITPARMDSFCDSTNYCK
jgi:hypothetical protein